MIYFHCSKKRDALEGKIEFVKGGSMIETKDLLLDKGRIADWKVIYENVWKHEGTARYTIWTAAQTKEAG